MCVVLVVVVGGVHSCSFGFHSTALGRAAAFIYGATVPDLFTLFKNKLRYIIKSRKRNVVL